MSTLTIAIGNSDDRLTQRAWADYWHDVHDAVLAHARQVFGVFLSASHAPYQNACWLIETATPASEGVPPGLTDALARLAASHHQESIAVAVGETVLVVPAPSAQPEAAP